MSCTEETGLQLSRYVDNELPADERKLAEDHLGSCIPCRDMLKIFQRNESVLGNALVGEVFGAQMVDEVMAQIRRLEAPTVVAPIVEDSPSFLRSWKTWASTAAALFLTLGLVVAFRPSNVAEMISLKGEIQTLKDAITQQGQMNQQSASILNERHRELSQELLEMRAHAALQATPDKTGLAFLNDRSIVAQAKFTPDKFKSFSVLRKSDLQKEFEVVKEGLQTAYYKDTNVVAGVTYQYVFRAFFKDGSEHIDSVPAQERLPIGDIKISFEAATPDCSTATFRVERFINKEWKSKIYTVLRGQSIGRKEYMPDGEIDFTTNYELDSIVAAEESLVSGTMVIASRPNKQARLKLVKGGNRDSDPMIYIWRDKNTFVGAPKGK